ncbi:ABC transporter ATP-binding protein/permease [Bosea sp. (in: a-proteobacteria)]|uniref:ABC transporter ATP-binding protein/permease n=1 Tax=Bosea sp. (in: a-proteobacteria) TaxID=1871050 RepID=UPI00121CF9FE|nr:ABC transporter ATP-binding protein/permease [Bosea sp. (in: a-proteobacteria)]TAJ29730.1 MAG: ATP-binding cassette domain-containing protein [Bosea sp. (in: a-proteobacteria)]
MRRISEEIDFRRAGQDRALDSNLFRYIWQKSRGEQIVVLLIILASIPFNWASFDVPKRIVNDAIQGGAFKDGKTTATLFDISFHLPDWLGGAGFKLFDGFQVEQLGLLLGLSSYFLLLVLINGAFKYVVNVRKGILGERMLRRMRFDLFSQLMRFRPEEIRSVKPAEIASMIKDEVEPVGAFVGDAFIQPVFLLSQALTALVFIMAQSFWLGSIALLIVLAQAIIIPILRREQLRLGRERQIESRALAGRIGEIVDAGPMIQAHGATAYVQADIAGRLGTLFDIRYALYKRKFAVKFLNNLLAQVTPFFFYAIGGFFALQGRLDIGQLVAVIAAYRDLPPPIKELIDWDQQRNDVTIKYEQVISQFNSDDTLILGNGDAADPLPERGEIRIDALQMLDNRGQPLLTPLSMTVPRPGVVALIGPHGAGKDVLGRILGRQATNYTGRVSIDGTPLAEMSVERASHLIGYAGDEPELIAGTIRDNILLPLKRHRPTLKRDGLSEREHRRFVESIRSGNPPFPFDADWTDYEGAGVADNAALVSRVSELLDVLGVREDIYQLGLGGKVMPPLSEGATARIIASRQAVAVELERADLGNLIEPFVLDRYNDNATIAENLIFGTRTTPRFDSATLLFEPYAHAILKAEALIEPLAEMGARIVATVVEIFSGLPQGHALFDRYSFGVGFAFERLNELADILSKQDMRAPLDPETERDLVALALGYIEPKHRLNLIDERLRRRILRARASFRLHLPADAADDIDFYDPERVMLGASVRDNLMFGRVGYGIADAERRVGEVVHQALARSGLEEALYRLGLATEAGIRGRHLPTRLRHAVPIVQALIKGPRVAVLDVTGLLAISDEPGEVLSRLRRYCEGMTLFLLLADASLVEDVPTRVVFHGATGTVRQGEHREPANDARAEAPGTPALERMEARS